MAAKSSWTSLRCPKKIVFAVYHKANRNKSQREATPLPFLTTSYRSRNPFLNTFSPSARTAPALPRPSRGQHQPRAAQRALSGQNTQRHTHPGHHTHYTRPPGKIGWLRGDSTPHRRDAKAPDEGPERDRGRRELLAASNPASRTVGFV